MLEKPTVQDTFERMKYVPRTAEQRYKDYKFPAYHRSGLESDARVTLDDFYDLDGSDGYSNAYTQAGFDFEDWFKKIRKKESTHLRKIMNTRDSFKKDKLIDELPEWAEKNLKPFKIK